jgi:hypothetical protein
MEGWCGGVNRNQIARAGVAVNLLVDPHLGKNKTSTRNSPLLSELLIKGL